MTNQPAKGPYRAVIAEVSFPDEGISIFDADGNWLANVSDESTAQLLADSWEMREELREQWEYNHVEHCRRDWPHEGDCHWPMPAVLAKYQEEK